MKLSQHEIFFFPDNCFTSSGIISGIEVLVNVCLFLFKNWFLTLRFVPQKFFVIKSFMFGHFCIRPLNMLTLFLSYGHHFLSLVFNAIFDFLGVSSPNSHQSKSTLTCKLSVGPLTLKIQSRSKKGAMAIWSLSLYVSSCPDCTHHLRLWRR